MGRFVGWFLCLVAFGPTEAGAQVLQMRTAGDIRPGVAAFPRIVAPDAAGARINMAVGRLEAHLLPELAECRKATRFPPGWQRSVTVPMQGPGYLALVASDATDCGGAHPETSAFVIVYDLQSGAPVDWSRLLPAAFLGRQSLVGSPGAKIVYADSQPMRDRYAAGYRPGAARDGDDAECRKDMAGDAVMGFFLYPDAKAGGLALLPMGLVHFVDAVCNEPVVIPAAELHRLGADARLVGAIVAAHAALHPPG